MSTVVHAQPLTNVHPKYLGIQSCGSSGCHGGAKDNFNQVLAWERRDFHTRTYATLTTARSARLAEVLKIGDPTQSTRCTSCHAPMHEVVAEAKKFVEANLQNPEVRTQPQDDAHRLRALASEVTRGLSCENCHGPAEHWIRTHTRTDRTHEDKVAAGMRDLRNFYVRASTCVACHQNVEPDLLKAGHPELIFELDGQCVTEPRHWRERRDDYGPALWLTGQAAALREMSWALAQQKEPLPKEVERWAALRWLLNKLDLGSSASNAKGADFAPTQHLSDQMARSAADSKWPTERVRQTLLHLARSHPDFSDASSQPIHARRAERLVLALDRLAVALPDDGSAVKAELNALFQAVQSLPDFDPKKFAQLLAEFEKRVQ